MGLVESDLAPSAQNGVAYDDRLKDQQHAKERCSCALKRKQQHPKRNTELHIIAQERDRSMKHLLRNIKLGMATMVLALGGLSFAATGTPAAHAASQPSITAVGHPGVVEVQGSGFTPGGTVFVAVYDAHYVRLNSAYVTASQNSFYCSPFTHICRLLIPGGAIDAFVGTAPYYGYVHVLAKDLSTSTWSNWSTTYVQIIP